MKSHIHTWNEIDEEYHIICSNCGIKLSDYQESVIKRKGDLDGD